MKRNLLLVALALLLHWGLAGAAEKKAGGQFISTAPAGKRVGIIGLDTSHAPEFASNLNSIKAGAELKGYRVVAAYPVGSPDIKSSVVRREGYTKQLAGMGIEIVDSVPALVAKVDCVLLESNDGRVHLEQALPVLKAHKPVFIDKPLAASLADVLAIFRAADKYGAPVFTASSLRWIPQALDLRGGAQGKILGADTFSPASLEPTHPDLYWYGIHGVEILYTVMGTGCRQVTRFHNADNEFCVGEWADGRIGTFRGTRKGPHTYGGTVFCEKADVQLPMKQSYNPLIVEIVKFFDSGKSPVPREEMIEIYTFMAAADVSKAQDGKPAKLAEVLKQAEDESKRLSIE